MRKPADMFDREWELLERFVEDERQGASLGVVSGRRRRGRAFLLEAVDYRLAAEFWGLRDSRLAFLVYAVAGGTPVDVAVVGHAEKGRPPLLGLGETKWNEMMRIAHLERLIRVRDLVAGLKKYDTTRTRLVCFSGAGFTPSLSVAATNGKVDLIGLNDLYTANG